MSKKKSFFLAGIGAFFLGIIGGFIVWILLQIINTGIDIIWNVIPNKIFSNNKYLIIYYMIIGIIGAIIISLLQKKNGILPEDTKKVFHDIKTTGKYRHDNLKEIAIATIIPLIFGGVLGPEAGLVGLIAGLCYMFKDKMKEKKQKLAKYMNTQTASALSESTIAITLGIIFQAPLFGVMDILEPDNKNERYKNAFLDKKGHIIIYLMAVLGCTALIEILKVLGINNGGIPRFSEASLISWLNIKYVIPLFIMGILFAIIYLLADKITKKIANKFKNNKTIICLIAGFCIAISGYFLPYTMFSGETNIEKLTENWQSMSITILFLTAAVKLIMVNICVNFGWRGGRIFPIIFGGIALGYAGALLFGINGPWAIAITLSALYGYIARKPLTVAAILLLCFPMSYIIPIIISAIIAAKIPNPFQEKNN